MQLQEHYCTVSAGTVLRLQNNDTKYMNSSAITGTTTISAEYSSADTGTTTALAENSSVATETTLPSTR
jgi:hypothetical protein